MHLINFLWKLHYDNLIFSVTLDFFETKPAAFETLIDLKEIGQVNFWNIHNVTYIVHPFETYLWKF